MHLDLVGSLPSCQGFNYLLTMINRTSRWHRLFLSPISPPQPQPLSLALLDAEFIFVQDNASKPPSSPLYRGPYKVLRRTEKFFILQVGDKYNSFSVDRLKAVISAVSVTPADPPL